MGGGMVYGAFSWQDASRRAIIVKDSPATVAPSATSAYNAAEDSSVMPAVPEPERRTMSQISTTDIKSGDVLGMSEMFEPKVDLDAVSAFAQLPADIQAILRQRIRRDMPAYRYLAQ